MSSSSKLHGGFIGALENSVQMPDFAGKAFTLKPIFVDNVWEGKGVPESDDSGVVGTQRNVDVDGITRQ